MLVADEGVKTSGSGHDDVRVRLLVVQQSDVVLDGRSTVKDGGLHVGHVLAEARILILDLESQLASMTHDEDRSLTRHGLDLLQSSQNEDRSLSETGLGLAEHIGSEDGLRNADLLDCSNNEVRYARRTEV